MNGFVQLSFAMSANSIAVSVGGGVIAARRERPIIWNLLTRINAVS
jgi:hypothetical protein